jgi:hypothetical protein
MHDRPEVTPAQVGALMTATRAAYDEFAASAIRELAGRRGRESAGMQR